MIRKLLIIVFAVLLICSLCGITTASLNVNLPQNAVTINVKHKGSQSYFDSTLKNILSGFDVSNGTYVGWCGNKTTTINTNKDYSNTHLYFSLDDSLPNHISHENWRKVNYIVNNKQGSDWWQVQYAIWYLLDYGDFGLNSYGWSMVENASLHGGYPYSPSYFDLIIIIADPGPNIQLQLIEHRLLDPNGDADGDGITNINEDLNDNGDPFDDDSDSDGTNNFQDIDDDGDGVNTSNEDVDGDGNPMNDDTDNDGISNYLDDDDDDDTILTLKEKQDGDIFGNDVDGDGIPNHLDLDSDGDGLLDKDEGTGDTDGDGIPDYLDPDDLEPPTQVLNLTVENVFNGNLSLKWNESDVSEGVDFYEVFRDGLYLIDVSSNVFLDKDLDIGRLYTYKVRAVDTSGNKGLFSDNVSNISTDIEPPHQVKNLVVADAFNGNLSLSWDEPYDYDGIDHYEIHRDGELLVNVSTLTYLDRNLVIGKMYNYSVRAVDFSNNTGDFSDNVSGVSNDTMPPSKVKNLVVTDAFNGDLSLSWDPATDNVGVSHYLIFRDEVYLTKVFGNITTDSNLEIGRLYTYKVKAVDTSGNPGSFSDDVSNISTDIEPPHQVKNLIVTDAFNGNLSLSWDEPYDYDGIHHYEIYRDGKPLINVSSLTHLDKNLVIGKMYNYSVRAVDFSNNTGDFSDNVSGVSNDTMPPSKVKNLVVEDAKDGKLDLSWGPATDNVKVDYYEIFRDNVSINITKDTYFRDTGLNNYQIYKYKVRAVDTSGNEGDFSDTKNGESTKTYKQSNNKKDDNNNKNTGSTNKPPVADTSAGEPYNGLVNEDVIFNGSKSYDPEGHLVKYLWDFGDGNTSLGQTVTHRYSSAGEYKVVLTVWDIKYLSDSIETTALIDEPNSPPSKPNVTGPTEGVVNVNYTFTVVSNDSDSDDIKYIIDWGDGNITESDYNKQGEVFSTCHKWIRPGSYIINVSSSDSEDVTTIQMDITIEEIDEPVIPEDNNFILIIFALLALMLLLLFILLAKRDKDDEEEQNN